MHGNVHLRTLSFMEIYIRGCFSVIYDFWHTDWKVMGKVKNNKVQYSTLVGGNSKYQQQ